MTAGEELTYQSWKQFQQDIDKFQRWSTILFALPLVLYVGVSLIASSTTDDTHRYFYSILVILVIGIPVVLGVVMDCRAERLRQILYKLPIGKAAG